MAAEVNVLTGGVGGGVKVGWLRRLWRRLFHRQSAVQLPVLPPQVWTEQAIEKAVREGRAQRLTDGTIRLG